MFKEFLRYFTKKPQDALPPVNAASTETSVGSTSTGAPEKPMIPVEPISKFNKIFRCTESLIRNPQRLEVLLQNLAGLEHQLNGNMYLRNVCQLSTAEFVQTRVRQQKELIVDVESLCQELSLKITDRQQQVDPIMKGRMEILRHQLTPIVTAYALEVTNFVRSAQLYEMNKQKKKQQGVDVGDVIIASYDFFYKLGYKIGQPLFYHKYEQLDPEFMNKLKEIVLHHAQKDVQELTQGVVTTDI